MVVYSQWLNHRDFNEIAALAGVSADIQRDLTLSHLRLEEAIAGDGSIDVGSQVVDQIAERRTSTRRAQGFRRARGKE